jgi:hypothetical protein
VRVVLVSLGGLTALLGGVVAVAMSQAGGYACLRFQDDSPNQNVRWVIDLNTSLYVRERLTPTPAPRRYSGPGSPNGKYMAYSRSAFWTSTNVLYLEERATGRKTLLQDGILGGLRFAWSADSRWLMYTWVSVEQQGEIVIVDASDLSHHRQAIPLRTNTQVYFSGWAPDSSAVGLSLYDASAFRHQFFLLAPPDFRLTTFDAPRPLYSATWARTGGRLVYAETQIGPPRLVFLAPGQGINYYPLEGVPPTAGPRLVWSADGRHLLVYIASTGQRLEGQRLELLRADENGVVRVAELAHGTRYDAAWSPDGRTVVYWSERPGVIRSLYAFRVEEGRSDLLADDIYLVGSEPLNSPSFQKGRMIVTWRHGGMYTMDMMDVDGTHRLTLLEDAVSITSPVWSPGIAGMALLSWHNLERTGLLRIPRLTTVRIDGSLKRTFDAPFDTISDLRWLDANTLLFTARQGALLSLELADAETGARRSLAGGFTQVVSLVREARTSYIVFWWRDLDGQVGYDGYALAGVSSRRVFRFQAAGPVDVTTARLFRSPDNRLAVIKTGVPNRESIFLATADGEPGRRIRSGMGTFQTVVWAPDNSRFGMISILPRASALLEILNADGTDFRRFTQFKGYYRNLAWAKCG